MWRLNNTFLIWGEQNFIFISNKFSMLSSNDH